MIDYKDLSPSEKSIFNQIDFLLISFDPTEKIEICNAIIEKYSNNEKGGIKK